MINKKTTLPSGRVGAAGKRQYLDFESHSSAVFSLLVAIAHTIEASGSIMKSLEQTQLKSVLIYTDYLDYILTTCLRNTAQAIKGKLCNQMIAIHITKAVYCY